MDRKDIINMPFEHINPINFEEIIDGLREELSKAEAKIEKLNTIVQPLVDVKRPYHQWLKSVEEIYFTKLMKIMKNNQSKTSEMACLNRGTTRKKLKQFNLIKSAKI